MTNWLIYYDLAFACRDGDGGAGGDGRSGIGFHLVTDKSGRLIVSSCQPPIECPSLYLVVCVSLFVSVSLALCVCLFVCLCLYLCMSLCVHVCTSISVCVSFSLSVTTVLSVCLSVFLSEALYPSLCLYICLCLSPSSLSPCPPLSLFPSDLFLTGWVAAEERPLKITPERLEGWDI